MLPKGKSRVAAILLQMKAGKDKTADRDKFDDDSDEEKDTSGLESAMDDFLQAMDDKNPKAMADALCDFLHIHEGCEGPEDEEDE